MASPVRKAAMIAGVLVACGDPGAPIRDAAYEFRGLDPNGSLVVFRWPPARVPVRYYVEADAGPVWQYLERALNAWEGQFLYGEFRGVLVADTALADVIISVAFSTPPDVPLTDDPPDIQACEGDTEIFLSEDETAIDGAMMMELRWDSSKSDTDVANCLARVVMHEVGHTIGLLGHSGDDLDLMAVAPTARGPTVSDKVTAQVLYHTPSDLLPSVRPQ